MNDMLSLLRGNGIKKSRTDFVKPVYIMNAILRSLDSGKWETVGGYKE